MTDPNEGLTRERDRRVQGGIVIAMVVTVVVGVVAAYLQVLAYHGSGGSGAPVHHPKSELEVSVPMPDRLHFVEAVERFAAGQRLMLWSAPIAPLNERTSIFRMLFLGDHGVEMEVRVGKNGQFVIGFTDKGKNGAERRLASAFRADVVEAGGFLLLP